MALLTLADGDRLYYEVHGDGPPLLLVSGLGGVASFWSPHVTALAARFRVILHDHRGTGRSSPSKIEYSVAQMTDDLVQLMDHLALASADLVGHSTGGAIGQTLALDHSARIGRLVLSATWTTADDYFRRMFEVRSEILRTSGAEGYVRSHALFMLPATWVRDRIGRMRAQEDDAIRAFPHVDIMLSRIRAILRFDRRADLPNLAAPTLVMGARDDIVTPAYFSEELGRLIPNAETVILDSGGHFFPVVEAETFRRHLLRFLCEE